QALRDAPHARISPESRASPCIAPGSTKTSGNYGDRRCCESGKPESPGPTLELDPPKRRLYASAFGSLLCCRLAQRMEMGKFLPLRVSEIAHERHLHALVGPPEEREPVEVLLLPPVALDIEQGPEI